LVACGQQLGAIELLGRHRKKHPLDPLFSPKRLLLSTAISPNSALCPLHALGIKLAISGLVSEASQENTTQTKEFIMTRKLSTIAIMACLASSLAFAGDKNKPASSADDAKAETTQTADAPKNMQQEPCASAKGDKKNKHNAKPAPTDQDREFDKVLQGIYG
jgi:hypothetical protein